MNAELATFLCGYLVKGYYQKMADGNICLFTEDGIVCYEGLPSAHPILEKCWEFTSKNVPPVSNIDDEFWFLPKEG